MVLVWHQLLGSSTSQLSQENQLARCWAETGMSSQGKVWAAFLGHCILLSSGDLRVLSGVTGHLPFLMPLQHFACCTLTCGH